MTAPTPPLGDIRPVLDTRCGYGDPPVCPELSAWHIVWTPDMENSLACEKHAQEAAGRWTWYDRHPLTEVCTMPEATCVWSWDDPPGRCLWVVSDETMAVALETVGKGQ